MKSFKCCEYGPRGLYLTVQVMSVL